jgi:uncharacterized protein (DUF362 family)
VRDFRLPTGDHDLPELAIAKSDKSPAVLAQRAVEAMGGMARFVSRGDVVVIKPNIGWDRMPVHAANTNPEVVAAIVRMAFDAGAKRVVVTDASCNDPNRCFQRSGIWRAAHALASCNDPNRCFQRSGIWRAAHALGADVVLPAEHRFRTMRMKGELLDEWPVYTPLVEADKLINVPVAKHHNLAKYTGAMKNWYGLLGGRRNRLHQSIDVSVADLATFMRPTLVVLDATRVLVRNGPQGGNVEDTKEMRTVVASIDQVAADAYGATLIGQNPDDVAYLKMGQARGLGTMRWESLRTRQV